MEIAGIWSPATGLTMQAFEKDCNALRRGLRQCEWSRSLHVEHAAIGLVCSGARESVRGALLTSPAHAVTWAIAGISADSGDHAKVCPTKLSRDARQMGWMRALQSAGSDACLAVYDHVSDELTLARDRFGAGHIYYAIVHRRLVFGSTLQTVQEIIGQSAGPDPGALQLLLSQGHIPAPLTIDARVRKLKAGWHLRVSRADLLNGLVADPSPYWDATKAAQDCIARRQPGPMNAAVGEIQAKLAQNVRVPAEAGFITLLSGGVDSSLIAALVQEQTRQAVTLAIGFDDPAHDELPWARKVADHLGTCHEEFRMKGRDALDLVEEVGMTFCEPFADSSQLPTLFAMRHLRGPGFMTGDGGDELFFGHGAYGRAVRNARMCRWLPWSLRCRLSKLACAQGERPRLGGLPAVLAELGADSVESHYRLRMLRWRAPDRVLLARASSRPQAMNAVDELGQGHPADRVQLYSILQELPDGLITKVASVAVSSGTAVNFPFLTEDLFRLAWMLPVEQKIHRQEHKVVLKRLLETYLPSELVYRRKKGFGAPVARWLAGDLREWAESLLEQKRLEDDGIFNVPVVRQMWREFLGGQKKWHTHLWPILTYLAWARSRSAPRSRTRVANRIA